MTRRVLGRLAAVAISLVALVAALTVATGDGLAQGSAAQANYAPANTAPPVVSGSAQVGQTLTGTTGTWTYQTTPTYSFQWQRCDVNGNTCSAIVGATATTYVVQAADSG